MIKHVFFHFRHTLKLSLTKKALMLSCDFFLMALGMDAEKKTCHWLTADLTFGLMDLHVLTLQVCSFSHITAKFAFKKPLLD